MDKSNRAQWRAQSFALNSTKAQSQLSIDSRNLRLSLLALSTSAILFAGNSFAAGGDFANTDFAAAAPFTYNHATGGGAYNDRTVGDFNDVTEQLEGGQFTCGDIVTYLAQVEVEANPVDVNQTIELDFRFLANSTGQAGAALSDIVNVAVNYGQVENGDNGAGTNPGAGFFGSDSGISDDGGSIATLVAESLTGPLFQSGSELLGTVRITDLEASEKVVVRIDTLLACDAGSTPTGNLQAQLDAGQVVLPASDTINTGQQTIPFLKAGEIIGAGEPLLTIEKSVTTADGVCGIDDTEQLNVFTGDTVKYCYTISNPGTSELDDLELIDDNGTPGDASDDFSVTITGLADLDGDADLGDLAAVTTVTGEALVIMPNTMSTVVNTAVVTGNNGLSGGNYKELTASDTATVNLEPSPNNSPVAGDADTTIVEDTPVNIDAAGNSSDMDGNLDTTSVTVTSEPLHGTVTDNGDGTLTYTPDPNYVGPDSFEYQICDTDGLCDTATVTLNVTPVNDPPIAADDTSTINQDTTAVINATTNDSDADGNLDPSSATVVSQPTNGTVTANVDGSFSYDPDAGFFGTDSFDYQVCDTDGACETATVTINVLEVVAVNNPPVAADDSETTAEDTPVTINTLINDSDPDGNLNSSSTSLVSGPSNGMLTDNGDGTFTYTPNTNFNGTDSFVYQVCDTDGFCDTATVTINVTPVNDAPVANDDSASTPEDTAVGIVVANNDTDLEGDLDPTSTNTTCAGCNEPSNGSLTNNGDGSFTYTPDANFNGSDSFSYQVCDTEGACDIATVTVDVTPVNDAPVAADEAVTTNEDTSLTINVLTNDTDVDGNLDSSTLLVTDGPDHGTLTQNPDGTFTYTPDANYNGDDSFVYQICDTDGLCDTATVTIDVVAVNDMPVAEDNIYSTLEDTTLSENGVLGNDSDVDGDALTSTLLTDPSNGSVTQNADGSLSYTPNANFFGEDSYTYQACDVSGACDEATVTIIVGAENDAPVANDDSYSVDEDTTLAIAAPGILANDTDVDGDQLTVNLLTEPSHGTLTQNANGSFSYTPDENFHGQDSYTYEACDPLGVCDSATVYITVNPVNDLPVALDDAYITAQDTTLTIAADGVLSNDSDIDGDMLQVDSYDATSVYGGTVSVNPDGSFSYTPAPGFAGYDTFTYIITDGNGGYATATVTIEVTAKNGRSISVGWNDWTLSGGLMSGDFIVTNQSGAYNVQLQSYEIVVQYRTSGPGKKEWIDVAVSGCTYDPAAPVILQDQLTVSFAGCQLAEVIPAGSTVRVTAVVGIYGHKDRGKQKQTFLSRLSKSL